MVKAILAPVLVVLYSFVNFLTQETTDRINETTNLCRASSSVLKFHGYQERILLPRGSP